MISAEEILRGKECPPTLVNNLQQLLSALNQFRSVYGKPMIVTSGYRTPEHNASVGGAPNSAHIFCMAADFSDPDRKLAEFCLANLDLLEKCGLYMEDPSFTPNWVHLQIRKAHMRVFIP